MINYKGIIQSRELTDLVINWSRAIIQRIIVMLRAYINVAAKP